MKHSPWKTHISPQKTIMFGRWTLLFEMVPCQGNTFVHFRGCNHRQHPILHPSPTVPGLVGVEGRIADLQSFPCHPGGNFFNPHNKGHPRLHEAQVAKKNTKTQHVHPVFLKQRFLFGIFISFSEHIHMKIERPNKEKIIDLLSTYYRLIHIAV